MLNEKNRLNICSIFYECSNFFNRTIPYLLNGHKIGLDWADKVAKEGMYPWFAKVLKSQKELDTLWHGAEAWRSVKVKA